jgi:hypothetical protein
MAIEKSLRTASTLHGRDTDLLTWPKAETGVRTLDLAKRLIDYGYHPPTLYLPLTVEEALPLEPTETESLETLDAFVETARTIVAEARTDPELLHSAPHDSPVRRLDETTAARQPNLRWKAMTGAQTPARTEGHGDEMTLQCVRTAGNESTDHRGARRGGDGSGQPGGSSSQHHPWSTR